MTAGGGGEACLALLLSGLADLLVENQFITTNQARRIKGVLEDQRKNSQIPGYQLLGKLVQKLVDEGYINTDQQSGGAGQREGKVDVKITDKSVDFLGFKTLKDLLGSLGPMSDRSLVRRVAMLYCIRGMCGCRTLSPQSSSTRR